MKPLSAQLCLSIWVNICAGTCQTRAKQDVELHNLRSNDHTSTCLFSIIFSSSSLRVMTLLVWVLMWTRSGWLVMVSWKLKCWATNCRERHHDTHGASPGQFQLVSWQGWICMNNLCWPPAVIILFEVSSSSQCHHETQWRLQAAWFKYVSFKLMMLHKYPNLDLTSSLVMMWWFRCDIDSHPGRSFITRMMSFKTQPMNE